MLREKEYTGDRINPHLEVAGYCLNKAATSAPVIEKTITRWGNVSLGEYLDTLQPSFTPSFQSREDFIDIYRAKVGELLGEKAGGKAAQEMTSWPMVLTANHLGVDYFSQSVQSSLLFYLLKRRISPAPAAIPVIACSSVPLDNVTYPLGALFYKLENTSYEDLPKKFPIFPNKLRRQLVSVAPSFDQKMIKRAEDRLTRMVSENELDPMQADALLSILRNDYNTPDVMELDNYSKQSLAINQRIWQRMFTKETEKSNIVTLDLEDTVSQLLDRDLQDSKSLIWSILMDTSLRERVTKRLDEKRSCWNLAMLNLRLNPEEKAASKTNKPASCGTLFFWGVNNKSRRIPLTIVHKGEGNWVFAGADDHGQTIEYALTSSSIRQALKERRLLPALFTSFTVLALARGITCLGGYYQAEYLPMMQRELVAALREDASYKRAAELIENTETGAYLSGMQAVMIEDRDTLLPAGPIEIIASGGLNEKDLAQILSLSVRDAHIASLFETMSDIAPRMDEIDNLKYLLAKECVALQNQVVVKRTVRREN